MVGREWLGVVRQQGSEFATGAADGQLVEPGRRQHADCQLPGQVYGCGYEEGGCDARSCEGDDGSAAGSIPYGGEPCDGLRYGGALAGAR